MENNPILKISAISHTFIENGKRLETLKHVSFEVRAGEFFSIVGPSGGGKSTLLRIIAGLVRPTHGTILLNTAKLAMVFQNFAIFPWLTVRENIEFGLKMMNVPKSERMSIALEKLKEVGLTGFDKKYPKELSGGMRQRVGLARALAVNPEVLLMDEPFSSLDAFTAEKLRLDLLEIWRRYKMTIIMVTHSVEEALELSDRIIIMTKRPAVIKQILEVGLARPRDNRSQAFFSFLDQITAQIEL